MARINPKVKNTNTNNKTDTAKNDTSTQTNSTKSSFSAEQLSYVKSLQNKPTSHTTQVSTVPDKPIVATTTQVNAYASTQNTNHKSQIYSTYSQNPVNVATADSNKAQPKYFTLATNASGQSYTIPSDLSLQARQYYAKLNIATTSILNPDWSGASKQDVMIDDTKISGTDKECGFFGWPTVQVGELGDPVKSSFDNDLPSVITKEDNPIANDVQLSANNYDTTGVNQANADYNYNLGQSLYNPNSSEPLDILSGQTMTDPFQQWMTQQNQNIVPTNAYGAFTQNGNGSQSIDAGVNNIKNTIGSIMQSKWFPFAIIGLVGIIVLSLFRGKSGGGQVPTVVRYG